MMTRTLPALLLAALALPALAAPNRPPADNSLCAVNDTGADGLRVTFTVTPAAGGAQVVRGLDVPLGQQPCIVAPAGRVEARAEQPGQRDCRTIREAGGGQMQVLVRVSRSFQQTWSGSAPVLACGE